MIFGPGLISVPGIHNTPELCAVESADTVTFVGAQHRRQRKMVNPAFSVDNMRNMMPIFYGITRKVSVSDLCSAVLIFPLNGSCAI